MYLSPSPLSRSSPPVPTSFNLEVEVLKNWTFQVSDNQENRKKKIGKRFLSSLLLPLLPSSSPPLSFNLDGTLSISFSPCPP